jgi:hypothetical protein
VSPRRIAVAVAVTLGIAVAVVVSVAAIPVTPSMADTVTSNGNLIGDVSCPTTTACVAVDNVGNVLVSTTPDRGGPFAVQDVDPGRQIDGVSCPSTRLCVAVDDSDRVLSSTDPLAAAGRWSHTPSLTGDTGIVDLEPSIACALPSTCVVADADGNLRTSTNPTGGASAWRRVRTEPDGFSAVSCPSARLCVGVGFEGKVATSTDPGAARSRWSAGAITSDSLQDITCPSASRCWATSLAGAVYGSDDPARGARGWRLVARGVGVGSIDCPTERLCIGTDTRARVRLTRRPDAGRGAWSAIRLADPAAGGWCAGTAFCIVASGADGHLDTTTDPTARAPRFHRSRADYARSSAFAVARPFTNRQGVTVLPVLTAYDGVLTACDVRACTGARARIRAARVSAHPEYTNLRLRPGPGDRGAVTGATVRVTYSVPGAGATSQDVHVALTHVSGAPDVATALSQSGVSSWVGHRG